MSGRRLREAECDLIMAMLCRASAAAELLSDLRNRTVEDMDDGGMGSVRFIGDALRRLGKTVAEVEYTDDDGVLVSIALNTDTTGRLYEIDFWKVDFALLQRYPSPSDLRIK